MMGDFADSIGGLMVALSVWALPVLVAVTLHEAAHGWAAWKLGDDTALTMGRVSFNPLRHIDPFGTVILPALLLLASGGRMMFGFAKPVPVRFHRLRRPRRDMVLVAIAGPAMNVALGVVAAAAIHTLAWLPDDFASWLGQNLVNALYLNMLLAVFNMLPIPPLDGGRVAVGLLPDALAFPLARLERAGILIVLGALFILPWIGGKLGVDLDVFRWLIGGPAEFLATTVAWAVGVI